MADLGKLKRKSTLGPPPSMDEASQNLDAPEIAPSASSHEVTRLHAPEPAGRLNEATRPHAPAPAAKSTEVTRLHRAVEEQPVEGAPVAPRARIDGRSLRKTDRTVPFASRVTPEFDEKLRRIAARDQLKLVEVLEKALALYEAKRKN